MFLFLIWPMEMVAVTRTRLSAEDTLFPEKLAKANEILRDCKNL